MTYITTDNDTYCMSDLFESTLINKDGTRIIPQNTRVIIMGYYFNKVLIEQNISVIPDNVKEIRFGRHYDKCLSYNGINVIPEGTEKISFGLWFDKPIREGEIPDSVKEISFAKLRNLNYLPPYINKLIVDGEEWTPDHCDFEKNFIIKQAVKSAIY